MEASSRKLPCAMTKDGRGSSRSEHLMPDPARHDPVFVGVRSARRYDAGYICYVGVDVTAEDIAEQSREELPRDALPMLDSFLRQLPQFKIDNVVAVTWRDGELELVKVADHTVRRQRKHPLP